MIKKIGLKRASLLLIIGGILLAILAADFGLLRPQLDDARAESSRISGEMTTLSDEVTTMKTDRERFEAKRALFDTIESRGFFNDQDRVTARQRLDAIQKTSNVISARYEIKAASVTDDDTVKDTDYVIVQTPMLINLTALTDTDIYKFIYYLNYAHPGNIEIKSLSIKRNAEINQEVLRSIGTGRPVNIVSAEINLMWTTFATRAAMLLPPRKKEGEDAAQGLSGEPAAEPQPAAATDPANAPAQGPQS